MQPVDFNTWISVTLSLQFIIISSLFFIIPFSIYLIIGSIRHGRNSSGNAQTHCMLYYVNSWISVLCYTLVGAIIYVLLIIYPLWLKLFN